MDVLEYLLLLSLWLVAYAAAPDSSLVSIANGTVQGLVRAHSRAFLGIPFAAAPTGALRWQPPHTHPGWSGVRPATTFGPGCEGAEDCLFLNVFTPPLPVAPQPSPKWAVMVYVHGGCWKSGSASMYDATGIVEYDGDVIVVTTNYRLSIMGFLGGSSVAARTTDGSSGNFGLQDQRMALRWVQDNVAQFGGDPSRVMLFGQSSGAASVANHLVMPKSWGLFHAAAMQSGAFAEWASMLASSAQAVYDQVLKYSQCQDLACLLALDFATLRFQGYNATAVCKWHTAWEAVVDGVELRREVWQLVKRGDVAPVPILMGTNRDEGATFPPVPGDASLATYRAYLMRDYGGQAATIEGLYPTKAFPATEHFNSMWWAAEQQSTDQGMFCPTSTAARWLALGPRGPSMYLYLFAHPKRDAPFVGHGEEIPFVFHDSSRLEAESIPLSNAMTRYWTQFAKTGDPNAGGLPHWAPYNRTLQNLLGLFGPNNITAVVGLKSEKCAFWKSFLRAGCVPLGGWRSGC